LDLGFEYYVWLYTGIEYPRLKNYCKFPYSSTELALGSIPNNTGCGVPFYAPDSPVKRVVGGDQVAPNSWPWMVN
jgi:hypothetical protein